MVSHVFGIVILGSFQLFGLVTTCLASITVRIVIYRHRKYIESIGFPVTAIHADNEFEYARDAMLHTELNTCAQGGHVPEIEHTIRRTKERTRIMTNNLPFTVLPRCMTRSLVRGSVNFDNAFI